MKEYQIMFNQYNKLFKETMNPVFFTLASYIKRTKTPILLSDLTQENELT